MKRRLFIDAVLRRVSDERGVALVVAAGVIMLVGILSGVVATAAIDLNRSSAESRNSKRALTAADAGIRRAIYHLNKGGPGADECVGTGAASGPTHGTPQIWCKGHGYLGQGVAYDFYVSQVLDGSSGRDPADCVGRNQRIVTQAGTVIPIDQRCIIAVGCVEPTVTSPTTDCVNDGTHAIRGTHRRLSSRTGAQTASQFFPAGLYGNDRLCIGTGWTISTPNPDGTFGDCNNLTGAGNAAIDTDVGSNILMRVAQGVPICDTSPTTLVPAKPVEAGEIQLAVGHRTDVTPPTDDLPGYFSGTQNQRNDCVPPTSTANLVPTLFSGPVHVMPDLDNPFKGCFTTQVGDPCTQPASADTGTDTGNNNELVTTAIQAQLTNNCAFWEPDNRELDLSACNGSNASNNPCSPADSNCLLLPPGLYNFCRLAVPNNFSFGPTGATPTTDTNLFVNSAGATPVRILIDSPYRPNSGCGKGSPRADNSFTGTIDTLGSNISNPHLWDTNSENCPKPAGNAQYRCADGSIVFANQLALNQGGASNQSLAFQIHVYGNKVSTPCPPHPAQSNLTNTKNNAAYRLPCPGVSGVTKAPLNTINFNNGAALTVALFAPTSTVVFNNPKPCVGSCDATDQQPLNGAIRALNIAIRNNLAFQQDALTRGTSQFLALRRYYRGPWIECRPDPSVPTSPRSGC